jgi:hypothetical protein
MSRSVTIDAVVRVALATTSAVVMVVLTPKTATFVANSAAVIVVPMATGKRIEMMTIANESSSLSGMNIGR